MMEEAARTAHDFFSDGAPKMSFSPNLFAAYSTDFVRKGNNIITIAAEPEIESMLHEILHTVLAVHREKIMEYSKKYGLADFASREKMMEFGYMDDDTATSITHVMEECFVRAISVVLAGKGDERLYAHAEYGCDSVPMIAHYFKTIRPTVNELGSFIDTVLADTIR